MNMDNAKKRKMIDNMNMTSILIMLVMLFVGNIILLITLIEKHNNFTEHHTTTTLINNNNPTISNEPSELREVSNIKKNDARKTSIALNRVGIPAAKLNDVTSVLWGDMDKPQQDKAYKMVLPYIRKHDLLLKKRNNQGTGNHQKRSYEWSCEAKEVGRGWGGHHLCTDLLAKSNTCEFISFGIAGDYSFETGLSNNFNCHGFAADPTVSYPTNIVKNVTFHQMGANILNANMELKNNDEGLWWITSVPMLRKALGLDRIDILKMDCEGCEYALARDIVRDDPSFFDHVDQFVVEVHLAREWLNTTETLYYYGILLKKLADAGLRLHDAECLGCSAEHTKTGCMESLPICGRNPNMCHNYLFARA